jgi:hypothetical protein
MNDRVVNGQHNEGVNNSIINHLNYKYRSNAAFKLTNSHHNVDELEMQNALSYQHWTYMLTLTLE